METCSGTYKFYKQCRKLYDCIGDQFIGALFNDIIGGINSELADAIGGVSNIFPPGLAGGSGIEDLLRSDRWVVRCCRIF